MHVKYHLASVTQGLISEQKVKRFPFSPCRDFIVEKSDLFPEDVRESCLSLVTAMKETAHTYLLNPMHEALKVGFFSLVISFDEKCFFHRFYKICCLISCNLELTDDLPLSRLI